MMTQISDIGNENKKQKSKKAKMNIGAPLQPKMWAIKII